MAGSLPSRRCGQGRADESEGGLQRAGDGSLPFLLTEGLECAGWRPAGVDDQEIEATELRDTLGHGQCRPVGRGQVGDGGAGIQLCPAGLERGSRPAHEHQPRALGCEHTGDATADAPGAATDQRALATQPQVHIMPPPSSSRGQASIAKRSPDTMHRSRDDPGTCPRRAT